jgi:hypothetical protein
MVDVLDRYYGERNDDPGNVVIEANPLHPASEDPNHDPLPSWWYVDCDHDFVIKVDNGPQVICRKCGTSNNNHQLV